MGSAETLAEKNRTIAEKRQYEERREQISHIKGRVYDVSDDHVIDINKKIDQCVDELQGGICGIDCVSSLISTLTGNKEKIGTSDANLGDYDSNLGSELSDCDRKIYELELRIQELDRRYHEECAREEAERRAREEAERRAREDAERRAREAQNVTPTLTRGPIA